MGQASAINSLNMGFLTILQDGNAFAGGYLVTNSWGRPLEFRMSSAVQANRVQQILYGWTLPSYICADVIGKTLVEKAAVGVQLLVVQQEVLLELRPRMAVPLVMMAQSGEPTPATESIIRPALDGKAALARHPRFPEDSSAIRAFLERVDAGFDLAEPFNRIREAMGEARKITRAAA